MSDETRDDMQFDEAEFEEGQAGAPSACAACSRPLALSYYTVNGHPACEECKAGFEARWTGGSGIARLARAVLLGTLGGLLGAAVYFGIAKLTGYELGLIAILTGWLAGKGVSIGSGHRGGRGYQLLAVLLTWFAIAVSYVPFVDEALLAEEAAEALQGAEPAGPGEPLPAEGFASLPAPLRWALELPVAAALPFLSVTESPMGLVILLIGLWTAWGTNKKLEFQVTGPHSLDEAPAAPTDGAAAPPPVSPPPSS